LRFLLVSILHSYQFRLQTLSSDLLALGDPRVAQGGVLHLSSLPQQVSPLLEILPIETLAAEIRRVKSSLPQLGHLTDSAI
jgi:hypothetical protein